MRGNSEFGIPVVERESGHEKGKKTSLLFYLPGLVLLSMMIVLPQGYQEIKSVLLFVTLAEVLLNILLRHRLPLHPRILHLFFLYALLGLMYGAYGLFRENLGALPITKEIVLYPAVFLILICGIKDRLSVEYVHRTLVLSACFLSVYMIATYLNANGIWPDWAYYDLSFIASNQDVAAGYLAMHGRTEMDFTSYPSLMFLQPYLFSYLVAGTGRKQSRLLWFAVIITTCTVFISSSNILVIIVLVFPMITISVVYLLGSRNSRNVSRIKRKAFVLALVVVALFLVLSYYGLNLHSVFEHVTDSFRLYQLKPSGRVVRNPRIDTFFALLRGLIKRPLFGFGSGAVCWEFVRNSEQPWSYELQYSVYLFNWGIIGCALYAIGVYYIFRTSLEIYRRKSVYGRYAIAATIGSSAFLFANATNPYLLRFDSFYVLFLAIAIVNLWLREKE